MIDERAKKIIDDWCKETKMKVEFTPNGLRVVRKLERKGAYVKELDELDNDLPIVNEAIVKYLTEDILPSDTIKNCNELIKFQKVVKVSSSYLYGWHNNEFLTDKTFRVFASKNKSDTYIGKCKSEGATIEKFANTSEHVFIENDDVRTAVVPANLDKSWYIDLAEKRIEEKFGISLSSDSLFDF